jgi:hypothetical protein
VARASTRELYRDSDGLYLQISKSVSKSWGEIQAAYNDIATETPFQMKPIPVQYQ